MEELCKKEKGRSRRMSLPLVVLVLTCGLFNQVFFWRRKKNPKGRESYSNTAGPGWKNIDAASFYECKLAEAEAEKEWPAIEVELENALPIHRRGKALKAELDKYHSAEGFFQRKTLVEEILSDTPAWGLGLFECSSVTVWSSSGSDDEKEEWESSGSDLARIDALTNAIFRKKKEKAERERRMAALKAELDNFFSAEGFTQTKAVVDEFLSEKESTDRTSPGAGTCSSLTRNATIVPGNRQERNGTASAETSHNRSESFESGAIINGVIPGASDLNSRITVRTRNPYLRPSGSIDVSAQLRSRTGTTSVEVGGSGGSNGTRAGRSMVGGGTVTSTRNSPTNAGSSSALSTQPARNGIASVGMDPDRSVSFAPGIFNSSDNSGHSTSSVGSEGPTTGGASAFSEDRNDTKYDDSPPMHMRKKPFLPTNTPPSSNQTPAPAPDSACPPAPPPLHHNTVEEGQTKGALLNREGHGGSMPVADAAREVGGNSLIPSPSSSLLNQRDATNWETQRDRISQAYDRFDAENPDLDNLTWGKAKKIIASSMGVKKFSPRSKNFLRKLVMGDPEESTPRGSGNTDVSVGNGSREAHATNKGSASASASASTADAGGTATSQASSKHWQPRDDSETHDLELHQVELARQSARGAEDVSKELARALYEEELATQSTRNAEEAASLKLAQKLQEEEDARGGACNGGGGSSGRIGVQPQVHRSARPGKRGDSQGDQPGQCVGAEDHGVGKHGLVLDHGRMPNKGSEIRHRENCPCGDCDPNGTQLGIWRPHTPKTKHDDIRHHFESAPRFHYGSISASARAGIRETIRKGAERARAEASRDQHEREGLLLEDKNDDTEDECDGNRFISEMASEDESEGIASSMEEPLSNTGQIEQRKLRHLGPPTSTRKSRDEKRRAEQAEREEIKKNFLADDDESIESGSSGDTVTQAVEFVCTPERSSKQEKNKARRQFFADRERKKSRVAPNGCNAATSLHSSLHNGTEQALVTPGNDATEPATSQSSAANGTQPDSTEQLSPQTLNLPSDGGNLLLPSLGLPGDETHSTRDPLDTAADPGDDDPLVRNTRLRKIALAMGRTYLPPANVASAAATSADGAGGDSSSDDTGILHWKGNRGFRKRKIPEDDEDEDSAKPSTKGLKSTEDPEIDLEDTDDESERSNHIGNAARYRSADDDSSVEASLTGNVLNQDNIDAALHLYLGHECPISREIMQQIGRANSLPHILPGDLVVHFEDAIQLDEYNGDASEVYTYGITGSLVDDYSQWRGQEPCNEEDGPSVLVVLGQPRLFSTLGSLMVKVYRRNAQGEWLPILEHAPDPWQGWMPLYLFHAVSDGCGVPNLREAMESADWFMGVKFKPQYRDYVRQLKMRRDEFRTRVGDDLENLNLSELGGNWTQLLDVAAFIGNNPTCGNDRRDLTAMYLLLKQLFLNLFN